MKKTAIRHAFSGITVFGLVWYVVHSGLHRYLLSISIQSWVFSAILGWGIMVLSSWIIFTARIGSIPVLKTLVLFPVCQSLAGLIFPFQGSLYFTSIYFSCVYDLKIGETVGVNILLLLTYIFFLGLTGLSLAYSYNNAEVMWLFGFILVIPIVVISVSYANIKPTKFQTEQYSAKKAINLLLRFCRSVQIQWPVILSRPAIVGVYVARIIMYLTWFAFLSHVLNTALSVHQLFYLIFAVEASLIFKFTPGNWGVSQASGGIALSLIGGPVTDGVLLITVSMISVLMVDIAIGYFAVGHFTRLFALQRNANLYIEVARQKSDLEHRN